MKFSIDHKDLLKALTPVAGIADNGKINPITSFVVFKAVDGLLSITGTDMEVELVSRVAVDPSINIDLAFQARKFFDVVRCTEGEVLNFSVNMAKNNVCITSGRSRFTLSTLNSQDFPFIDLGEALAETMINSGELSKCISITDFAMANGDTRPYLNGMNIELEDSAIRFAATDGLRLAYCDSTIEKPVSEAFSGVIPRKAILTLKSLTSKRDENILLSYTKSHFSISSENFTFTSKLIDGKFPDYNRVIPKGNTKSVITNRSALKGSLTRAVILSDEKLGATSLTMGDGLITVKGSNTNHEESTDELDAVCSGEPMEIHFRTNYMQDVLGCISSEDIDIKLEDSLGAILIQSGCQRNAQYVVSPIRV